MTAVSDSYSKEQTFSEEIEVDGNDSPFPRPDVLHIIAMNTNGTILGSQSSCRCATLTMADFL